MKQPCFAILVLLPWASGLAAGQDTTASFRIPPTIHFADTVLSVETYFPLTGPERAMVQEALLAVRDHLDRLMGPSYELRVSHSGPPWASAPQVRVSIARNRVVSARLSADATPLQLGASWRGPVQVADLTAHYALRWFGEQLDAGVPRIRLSLRGTDLFILLRVTSEVPGVSGTVEELSFEISRPP